MSDFKRILNLDADSEIQVTLGGKPFVIRQQRRALIEKILHAVNDAGDQVMAALRAQAEKLDALEEAGKTEEYDATTQVRETIQQSGEAWERSLPVFALIFGFEPGDAEYGAVLAHLTEHLSFSKGEQIYNAWHDLNEVRRFFERRGNPLIANQDFQDHLAERQAGVVAAVASELPKSD